MNSGTTPNASGANIHAKTQSSTGTGRVSSLRRRNRTVASTPVSSQNKSLSKTTPAIVAGADIYQSTSNASPVVSSTPVVSTTPTVSEAEVSETMTSETSQDELDAQSLAEAKALEAEAAAKETERLRLAREEAEKAQIEAKKAAKEAAKEAKKAEKEAKKAEKRARKQEKRSKKASKKAERRARKSSKKKEKRARKSSKNEEKRARKSSKKEERRAKKAAEKLEKEMANNTIRMTRRKSTIGSVEAAVEATKIIAEQVDYSELKVKLVIPIGCGTAGDSEFTLECLLHYALESLDDFDGIVLYRNTDDTDDVAYFRTLTERLDERFTIIEPEEIEGGEDGLSWLFASSELRQLNTLYIFAEDDVVYAGPDSFKNLIQYAKDNRGDHTVFSGNVVNNGPLDRVHQQRDVSFIDDIINYDDAYDELHEAKVAQQVHASALCAIKHMDQGSPLDYYMKNHRYLGRETFALNVFAFFGDSFTDSNLLRIKKKGLSKFVTSEMGESDNKFAIVVGQTFFVHYAFPEQLKKKNNFDPDGIILNDYRKLAGLEGENARPIISRFDK